MRATVYNMLVQQFKHFYYLPWVSDLEPGVCHSFFLAQKPTVGQGLLIHDVSGLHTTTHHSRSDSSGRVISSSLRPLPDNTQHSHETNFHAPGGIRNQNLSRKTAARPLGPACHNFSTLIFKCSAYYYGIQDVPGSILTATYKRKLRK
jgi:hypothetical protein